MIPRTTLRELVTDKKKAYRLRQHCRCYIDTKRGGRMVSCFAPGREPGFSVIIRQIATENRNRNMLIKQSLAMQSIANAIANLLADGVIGRGLADNIMGEAVDIMRGKE